MIQISVTTIVICAIIIVAAVITPMVNIFFRKVGNGQEVTDDSQLPCLSVLLTVQDNARELEQHLPALLTQDYPAGFEVIVVVSKGEDDTDDVLKKLSATYPNLYTTFIPDSSRYMSRKKLAVTLGVKAARHEWILMTEASFQPASDQWLKTMARHCQEDHRYGYRLRELRPRGQRLQTLRVSSGAMLYPAASQSGYSLPLRTGEPAVQKEHVP